MDFYNGISIIDSFRNNGNLLNVPTGKNFTNIQQRLEVIAPKGECNKRVTILIINCYVK